MKICYSGAKRDIGEVRRTVRNNKCYEKKLKKCSESKK